MAEALLSAFLQVLFQKLASKDVLDFFETKRLDKALLKKLEIALISANKLLYDAEQKWFTDPLVKKWMAELKDAVYDAEDLLDEIATKMLEQEAKAESGTTTCRLCNKLTPPFMSGSIGSDLNNAFERLGHIVDLKDKLGLKEVVGKERDSVYRVRSTTSLMEKSHVFGRQNDKEAMLELLLSNAQDDESNANVIAVLGMGGMGKTTLAQLAYNDKTVEEHFQLKGWVCVSDPFDLCKLTKITLEEFGSPMNETDNINQLQLHLKMVLTGKKFLLILDDVWNEDYNKWNDFLTPLTYGAPGSKIVVTTRNERVAQVMKANKLHWLDKLQDEDSWGLFLQHAFDGHHNYEQGSKFEQVARDIVEKCGGLPLALKTMGRLLHSEGELSKWEAISKSNLWESQLGKSILPPLLLSYCYLSPQLKRCFSYCSIFPKDCIYDKQQLILLWIAEDIITKDSNDIRTIEEVGEECFNDLISRSLLHYVDDRKSCFSMHHLVNDLAKFIAGQTLFSLDGGRSHEVSIKTRHLSYLRQWYDVYSKFKELSVAKNLRTFMPLALEIDSISSLNQLNYETVRHLIPTLKRLRVLSLIGFEKLAHLPIKMETLRHLRFLDLSYNDELEELPDSICSLHNLQTLLLVDCYSLVQLPANIARLSKLRHLDLKGTYSLRRMPVGMGKLKHLQTLTDYVLTEGNGSQIKELGALENLTGSLAIKGLVHVSSKEAEAAFLKGKKSLKKLVLRWGFSSYSLKQKEEEVLERLHPHENLKELTIEDYYGKMFPDWLTNSIPNISVVELMGCQHCELLPPLGQLPSLKSLRIRKLHGVVRVGSEFEGNNSNPFRSLESLEFDDMKSWKEWNVFEGQNEESSSAFPCLQDLTIRNCPELTKALPSRLHSLLRIIVEDCPKLEASIPTAPDLQELKLENCDNLSTGNKIERLKSMQVRRLSTFSIQSVPPGVTNLRVADCDEIEFARESEHPLLQYINLNDGYGSLVSLPLDKFPSLRGIAVEFADNLEYLSSSDGSSLHPIALLQLNSLFLLCCNKLASFPSRGLNAPSLTLLRLWQCSNLKLLPENMHTLLPSLRSLEIEFCPQLEMFPMGGLPPSLVELQIYSSKKLVRCHMSLELQQSLSSLKTLVIDDGLDEEDSLKGVPFPQEGLLPTSLTSLSVDIQNMVSLSTVRLQRLTSLQELTIKDCSDLRYLFSKKDKEEDMQLPSSLTSLSITGCVNLESLENIGLHCLTSLQKLNIHECPKLQAMPMEPLPASLLELCIDECPRLSKRCQRLKGKDWKRIAHIPYIVIDGVVVSY